MGLRLKVEHRSRHNISGPTKGHLWKVEIYDKNYDGPVQVIPHMDVKAIGIAPSAGARNMFHYVKPTVSDIHLINDDGRIDDFLDDLKAADVHDMYGIVYRGNKLEIKGYLLRNQITRDDTEPEFVKLVITDSLALLDKHEYINTDQSHLTGDETLLGHMMQILRSIYVDELYDDDEDILAISVPYYEVNMGDKLTTSPWAQTRLNHQAFTELETRKWIELTVNTLPSGISYPVVVPKSEVVPINIASCLDVVKRLHRPFNAELLHQDGYYHIITKSEYDKITYAKYIYKKNGSFRREVSRLATPLDKVINIKLAKGQNTYLDPLKRIQIDHELGVARNLIAGLTWDDVNNDKVDDVIFISNAFSATLDIAFVMKLASRARELTTFPAAHHYLFRVEIKVGQWWLRRTYEGLDELGDPVYAEADWDFNQSYVEVFSPNALALTSSGLFSVRAETRFESPLIPASGMLCVGVSLGKVLGSNGTIEYPLSGIWSTFVFGQSVNHNYEFTWSSYNSTIRVNSENQEENENSRTFIRSTAEISPRNGEIHKDTVKIGDDPGGTNYNKLQILTGTGAWEDSSAWQIDNAGDIRSLIETMTWDMARLRTDTLDVMMCNMICMDEILRPSTRVSYKGITYIPLSYDYNSELEQSGRGEFIEVKKDNLKASSSSTGRISVGVTSVPTFLEITSGANGGALSGGGGDGLASSRYYQEWKGIDVANNELVLGREVLPDPAQFPDNSKIHARVILTLNGADMYHDASLAHRRHYHITAADRIVCRDIRPNDIIKLRMP